VQTIVLLVLVLVNFAKIAELFPILEPLHLGKAVFVLGFAFLFLLPKGHIKNFYTGTSFLKFTLLFYIACLASVPFAIWRGGAVDDLMAFSRIILICVMSILFSSNSKLPQLKLSLFSGIAILVVNMLQKNDSLRLSVSSTYDSNDMGVLLLTFFPLILADALKGPKVLRIVYAALAVGVLYCIILTGSRGAIVALSFQALYFIYASKRFRVVAIVFVVIASFVVISVADVSLWERFQSLSMEGDQADYNLTDSSGRLAIWKQGLDIFVHNPILGVGIGQFGTALFYLDGKIGLTAHNTYLQVAAEIGIFGVIFFLGLLWKTWTTICRHNDDQGDDRVKWFAAKIGMVGQLVGIFFISAAYTPLIFYFLGLVAVMHYSQIEAQDMSFAEIYRPVSKNLKVRS